eukprot:3166240-Pleurochrysis_carterae.AAC.2
MQTARTFSHLVEVGESLARQNLVQLLKTRRLRATDETTAGCACVREYVRVCARASVRAYQLSSVRT